MKLKFDFDPHGCKAIFRKYAAHEAEIRNTVINQITQQIDTGFAKTKLATRLLSHELHVYECRVNIGKLPPIRAAFTVAKEHITVVYISINIQKSTFTKEITDFLK